jgi:hypothetical protein
MSPCDFNFHLHQMRAAQVRQDTPRDIADASEVTDGHSSAASFANQGEGTATKCLSPILPEKFA